jgi:hypothetical protein
MQKKIAMNNNKTVENLYFKSVYLSCEYEFEFQNFTCLSSITFIKNHIFY